MLRLRLRLRFIPRGLGRSVVVSLVATSHSFGRCRASAGTPVWGKHKPRLRTITPISGRAIDTSLCCWPRLVLLLQLHICQLAVSFNKYDHLPLAIPFYQYVTSPSINRPLYAFIRTTSAKAKQTTSNYGGDDGRRRWWRRTWSRASAGAVVYGNARVHALVDSGNSRHRCSRTVRDLDTISVVLQLQICLSEAASMLLRPNPFTTYLTRAPVLAISDDLHLLRPVVDEPPLPHLLHSAVCSHA